MQISIFTEIMLWLRH